MKNVKGVIFDFDGTLVDSMWKWGDIAEEYLISHGATPRPGIRDDLRNFNTAEEAQYYIDEYGIDVPLEEIIAGRDGMMLGFFSREVELKTGALPVLKALRERGVKMCVVTASDRHLVEPALKLLGITDYFERIITCTEENTSKASPDIYIRAAELLGADIGETMVVEDGLYALETAKKAGFIVAGVYDEVAKDHQEEIKALCDYYWKHPGEMLECL